MCFIKGEKRFYGKTDLILQLLKSAAMQWNLHYGCPVSASEDVGINIFEKLERELDQPKASRTCMTGTCMAGNPSWHWPWQHDMTILLLEETDLEFPSRVRLQQDSLQREDSTVLFSVEFGSVWCGQHNFLSLFCLWSLFSIISWPSWHLLDWDLFMQKHVEKKVSWGTFLYWSAEGAVTIISYICKILEEKILHRQGGGGKTDVLELPLLHWKMGTFAVLLVHSVHPCLPQTPSFL